MTREDSKPAPVSDQALEMVMRDVLDGMLELTLDFAFAEHAGNLEIIEIAPAQVGHNSAAGNADPEVLATTERAAEVLRFPLLKKAAG